MLSGGRKREEGRTGAGRWGRLSRSETAFQADGRGAGRRGVAKKSAFLLKVFLRLSAPPPVRSSVSFNFISVVELCRGFCVPSHSRGVSGDGKGKTMSHNIAFYDIKKNLKN